MQTTILSFRPVIGHYVFREQNLVTTTHAHPSLEVIRAEGAAFSLTRGAGVAEDLHEAIIAPNQPHAFHGATEACRIELFDLELLLPGACDPFTQDQLREAIRQTQVELSPKPTLRLVAIVETYTNGDPLIGQAVRRLRDTTADQPASVAALSTAAGLSESQFTRRFTRAMGLPLRTFHIYRRLRRAVEIQVTTGTSLTEAAYTTGFTDLAHFSRQFAACFGVRPSLTYRAGSVQVHE